MLNALPLCNFSSGIILYEELMTHLLVGEESVTYVHHPMSSRWPGHKNRGAARHEASRAPSRKRSVEEGEAGSRRLSGWVSACVMAHREICKYFLHGACRHGAQCRFSHDMAAPKSTVCTYYLAGNCTYGDKCRYDHVRPEYARPKVRARLAHASWSRESSRVSHPCLTQPRTPKTKAILTH